MTASTQHRSRSPVRAPEADRSMVVLGYLTGLVALVSAAILGLVR